MFKWLNKFVQSKGNKYSIDDKSNGLSISKDHNYNLLENKPILSFFLYKFNVYISHIMSP